jgi:UDP-N-acetylmuramate dehydrogenase
MTAATDFLVESCRAVPGLRVWRNAPIAPFTTIGVGGRAGMLLSASTTGAVVSATALLSDEGVPWSLLGGGSNLLVADSGFPGALLMLDEGFHFVEGARPVPGTGQIRVVVGAGLPAARLASHVAEAGLSGLEFACAIPGSVGGSVVMNAGAHGSCMADVVDFVQLAGPRGSAWVRAEELRWTYRECRIPDDAVVTAASFLLVPSDRQEILAAHRVLLQTRRRTQPRAMRSFGSTFKNPPGDSAGRLLDAAGLKGVRRGGAQVSPVHANFVTNLGDATAADVLALMGMMEDSVLNRSGIRLEREVRVLGLRR